jgi:hypothetical protein
VSRLRALSLTITGGAAVDRHHLHGRTVTLLDHIGS